MHSTNDQNKKEFQKIENRCLKIIDLNQTKDETRQLYSIPNILTRFEYLYLLTFYKLVNSQVPIIDSELLPKKLTSKTRLSKSEGLQLSKDKFRFAIANFGAKQFNSLPHHIKLCSTVITFKSAIKSHLLHY